MPLTALAEKENSQMKLTVKNEVNYFFTSTMNIFVKYLIKRLRKYRISNIFLSLSFERKYENPKKRIKEEKSK